MITSFQPFGGEDINAAQEAVRQLPDAVSSAELVKVELPVVFGAAADVLTRAIGEKHPDAVICVGQAGGRAAITVEKVAVNLRDARIPDNEGNQPIDEPVAEGGPAAYFSSLPVREMVERMQEAGIPAAVSYSAGTFVCNDIMYRLLHLATARYPDMPCGFIHVPYTPAQAVGKPAGTSSMALSDMVRALECAAACVAKMIKL